MFTQTEINGTTNGHSKKTSPGSFKGKYQISTKWSAAIELITPSMAKNWLSGNDNNRNISGGKVEKLVRQIKNGEWTFINQGVGFNDKNELVDGQHRLTAIAVAGIAVPMVVVRGLQDEARTVVDTGRPRSDADNMRMYAGVERAARKVAIANVIYGVVQGGDRPDLSYKEKLALVDRHEEAFGKILPIVKAGVSSAAPIVAALVFAHPKAPEQVEAFAHALYARSGDGWGSGTPVFALDAYLTANRNMTSGGYNRAETFKRVCHCLRAHISGTPMKKTHATNDAVEFFR